MGNIQDNSIVFRDTAHCKEVFCLRFIASRSRLKHLPKHLKQQWHIHLKETPHIDATLS